MTAIAIVHRHIGLRRRCARPSDAAQRPRQLPHRNVGDDLLLRPDDRDRRGAQGHVRRRICGDVPRRRALPVGKIYKLREVADAGRDSPLLEQKGLHRADVRQRAGPRAGRDASIASSRTSTSAIASTNMAKASCSTPRKGSPDMMARSSSACAAWSPISRSTESFRSRRPAPVIPRPSPASRRERSIRARRSPKPIAATMPAAMPKLPNSSRPSAATAMLRLAAPKRLRTKRSRSRTSAAMPKPTLCSPARPSRLGADPLVARRLRNYRAMHLLNQGDAKGALAELDKPLPNVGYGQRRRCQDRPRN